MSGWVLHCGRPKMPRQHPANCSVCLLAPCASISIWPPTFFFANIHSATLRMASIDVEDILNDALDLVGGESAEMEDGKLAYGPITVSVAPKVCYTVRYPG